MIRLVIADDHHIVREGLKRIISECEDMVLVGEAEDGYVVSEQCAANNVDILLLDISMPGPGFLETLKRVSTKFPQIKTLVLSVYPENHYAIRAIKSGAWGYLTKNHSPEELPKAIRHIYKGKKYVTPTLAENLADEIQSESDKYKLLSDREYQILCLLGKGLQPQEISEKLCISPKTVGTYRSRILVKLKLEKTAELIRYAIENELEE